MKKIIQIIKKEIAHKEVEVNKWEEIKWELYKNIFKEQFKKAERKLWKRFEKEGGVGEQRWEYYQEHRVEEKVKMIAKFMPLF